MKTRVLLIEDDPGDARLIVEVLKDAQDSRFEVVCRQSLADGLETLEETEIDIILLDLSLPDSQGLRTLDMVRKQFEGIPILVLTGLDDKKLSLEAVKRGAQDYLLKGTIHTDVMERCIKYAIERHQLLDRIRATSLTDVLTGLHNRRGFEAIAHRELKLANRHGTSLLLVFLDINDLKDINDSLGHQEGDRALVEFASILSTACRETDLVARVGGDEFLVLLREDTQEGDQALPNRIKGLLAARNEFGESPYSLAAGIGVARYEPGGGDSLENLIARADERMYQQKQAKQPGAGISRGPEYP